jgi:hypothetical protein
VAIFFAKFDNDDREYLDDSDEWRECKHEFNPIPISKQNNSQLQSPNPIIPQQRASNPIIPQQRASNPIIPQQRASNPIIPQQRASNPIIPQQRASNPIIPQQRAFNSIILRQRAPTPQHRISKHWKCKLFLCSRHRSSISVLLHYQN